VNKQIFSNKNFYIMLLCDSALVYVAYFFSFYLRFEGNIPPQFLTLFHSTVPIVLIIKLLFFFSFNLYRGMWRFTSLKDLKNVTLAVASSSTILTLYILFLYRFEGYSRSVYVIDVVLTLLFIGGVRVGVRLIKNQGFGINLDFLRPFSEAHGKRTLIIGAGNAGEKSVREMMDNSSVRMRPVGFLDDDPNKWGKTIHGVPVLGKIEDISRYVDNFDEILIAIPSAKGAQIRHIVDLCTGTGKRFRTMPNLGELIDGKVSVKAIRDIKYEDLLGRDEVRLDADVLQKAFAGKRILVTGAGGSIGSELIRQLCYFKPNALALLDFSEYNLFQIENRTRQHFENVSLQAFLVDVRDMQNLVRVFTEFKPEVVFHAAAYKHVPLQELNPWEAVLNNVRGTRNLVYLSQEYGVERFVLVSTDKAVRPTNIMGATKRVAELFVEGMNGGSGCRFVAVRFGNVLGSSGSVIPLFEEQIAARVPVTVTHPEVTRYFMSIVEAAQLILQAGAMGSGGEIFILDMGRPVRIADMARDLMQLHGLEPDVDLPIQYVGLRPGEKLYEELITEGEGIVPTAHAKIRVLRGKKTDLSVLNDQIEALTLAAQSFDTPRIKSLLKEIVPEYRPQ
jgi:FlaA1/EpsC-like NDP-sugar epimerase